MFGARLQELRDRAGLTKAGAARAALARDPLAAAGLDENTVAFWERERDARMPNLAQLLTLAEVYGASTEETLELLELARQRLRALAKARLERVLARDERPVDGDEPKVSTAA